MSRVVHALGALGIEPHHDVSRRCTRREHALPKPDIEIGKRSRLGDGRHVRRRRRAFRRGDRDELQRARLDLCPRRRKSGKEEIDVATQEIVERRSRALVRHVSHVAVGAKFEQLAGKMARRPSACGRECQRARRRSLDHLRDSCIRRAAGNDQSERHHGCERHRLQIALGIVAQAFDPVRVDRHLGGLTDPSHLADEGGAGPLVGGKTPGVEAPRLGSTDSHTPGEVRSQARGPEQPGGVRAFSA